ncbi:MAG TPA: 3-deoxy-7-phosphoheptulonate synthase [Blastocatellia bacterium]|nr:3-deoxy-7-phosphoheptulonate synthase [Blastocatellia bacterium]
MLIVMKSEATDAQVEAVLEIIRELGFKPHPMPGATRTAIGITGNQGAIDPAHFENLPGVAEAIRVSKPYKLVGRDLKHDDTIVRVGDVEIGGAQPAIIAGPCAVESLQQTMEIAEIVASTGVKLFRGGAFKPRTSPYAFQGLAEEGLKILAEARDQFGLSIVTEVLDTETADLVERYADVMQVGARNMQNFSLLRRVGQARKPVMLKRGMSATLDEFLLAAEYIMAEGNYNVILCERGVRTFADHSRNTLDLSIIPAVQNRSHLPIIVDPSHGTGKRHKVIPLARASIAAGADGIMVEVHNHPERALSDGPQALLPEMFKQLVEEVHAIHRVIEEAERRASGKPAAGPPG